MTSLHSTIKTLWRRAPLWRFFLMSSLLLTLLFILFPPQRQQDTPHPEILPTQATYKPQPVLNNDAPPAGPSAAAASSVQPKTAAFSLALPDAGGLKQNETGLNEAMTGRAYSGSLQVSGYAVPLPEGNWVMLANSSIHYQENSGMSYFLGRIENKRLTGAITVYALKSQSPAVVSPDWPIVKSSGCDRLDSLYMPVKEPAEDGLTSCWFVFNYFTPPLLQWADKAVKIDNLSKAAGGDLAAKGVSFPQDFVGVKFVRAAKWGVLSATYLFTTDIKGIHSNEAPSFSDSDWYSNNIHRFPEKVAFVEKMKQWGFSFLPHIKEAFNDGHEKNGGDEQAQFHAKPAAGEDRQNTSPRDETHVAEPVTPVDAVGVTIQGMPVKIGDTIEDVQKAFNTDLVPQLVKTSNPDISPVSVIHLAQQGVWVFFQNNKTVILRMDAAFAGNISGIKIGDPSSKIEKILGPAQHGSTGKFDSYTYNFSSLPTIRFEVNPNHGQLERIFFQEKKSPDSAEKSDQPQVFSNDSFPSYSESGHETLSMSALSPPSHYAVVAVTRENMESELKKCIPELVVNPGIRNDIQNFPFPASTIKTFGHVNSAKKFVLHEAAGVCMQKSPQNFTVFAADEFIDTINPKGLSPDVVEGLYKKIAVLIATKGMAKIAYVFTNGNASIATYWVENSQDYALFYSHAFKKAGEWEGDTFDIKYSNPAMTSVSETKRAGLEKKQFPLAR